MGTVNGRQGELEFDRLISDNSSPDFIPIPRTVPQKVKPAAKADHHFFFEPHMDGPTADYSEFPANRMYIANDKTILNAERPQ
jgi:hypothetical protein